MDLSVQELFDHIYRDADWITDCQRDLHAHPELGYEERRTAARVQAELERLGFQVTTGWVGTGVVGTMVGGRPGLALGLRADLDGFPIEEADDGTPWRSQNLGVSHACGHDAHVAITLGVARAVAQVRDRWPGTLRFIFQPAEEMPKPVMPSDDRYLEPAEAISAARVMIADGVLRAPDLEAIYGLHLWPWLPTGQVGVEAGPAMAGVANFTVSIFGHGSHGAAPHSGVDAIVAAASAVMLLQTVVSRQTPPSEPLVITIGTIRGGDRRNVIADRVDMSGTVRSNSAALLDVVVPERVRAVLAGVDAAYGVTHELKYHRVILPLINDAALAERARQAVAGTLGADVSVAEMERGMTSEDFAYYADAIPGLYVKVGCTAPGQAPIPLHNRGFRFDPDALVWGAKAVAAILLERASGETALTAGAANGT